MKLYTIYDSKADTHGAPIAALNEDMVKRQIMSTWEGSQLEKYAEDFTLFEIAAYDEITGTITPYKAHRSISTLLALRSHGNHLPMGQQTE